MIFVRAESITHETLQVTLQLNEPGTLWCQATETATGTANCATSEMQASSGLPCYFETFIQGSSGDSTVFTAPVHTAFRDVDINIDKIWEKDMSGSAALEHEHTYNIFCYAEDDWDIQATAATNSISYSAPVDPNKSPWADVSAFMGTIGVQTTLDETPPSFTTLEVADPTAANNKIVVTFSLNEAGTAYCRATRSDSGEVGADMTVNRILTADWSGVYSSSASTIEMTKLENIDPTLTIRDDEDVPFEEQTQYDIYCWAQDSATNSAGAARPNYMLHSYVATAVGSTSSPSGGLTSNVWVLDSTPPTMIFVSAESLDKETLQVTLQLNEPGTLWCAAAELSGASATYCEEDVVQDSSTVLGTCYYEQFI